MSRARGAYYEEVAAAYLKKRGLQFVAHNYHCRCGEIDLIFKQGETLVFIEVRYRQAGSLTSALESIDHYKQRRLMLTAQHYLHYHHVSDNVSVRFDVVLIQGQKDRTDDLKIEWLQDVVIAEDWKL